MFALTLPCAILLLDDTSIRNIDIAVDLHIVYVSLLNPLIPPSPPSLSVSLIFLNCNALIPRVRRRYCDVYTQVKKTLTYIR